MPTASTRRAYGAMLAVMSLLAACGDDEATGPPPGPSARVVITHAHDTILVHDRAWFVAKVLDADGDTIPDPELAWSSSAPDVFSVSSDGLVTALTTGSGFITARQGDLEASAEVVSRSIQFTSVSLGRYATCGIDLEDRLWCWGDLETIGAYDVPPSGYTRSPRPLAIQPERRFRQVSVDYGLCGIQVSSSSVTCWEVGDGGPGRSIPGTGGATKVARSGTFGCALLQSREVACWGSNDVGQLGDATRSSRPDARVVPGLTDAIDIDVGRTHACARRAAGDLWCWGNNAGLQLGADTTYDALVSQVVPGVTASRVTGGARTYGGDVIFCAEASTPNLTCWGRWWSPTSRVYAPSGEYDVPTTQTLPVPMHHIEATADHACGLAQDGTAWCWGLNHFGQLGRGTLSAIEAEFSPAPVQSEARFISLSLRSELSCGLTGAGEVWCWGNMSIRPHILEPDSAEARPVRVASPVAFREWQIGSALWCGLDEASRPWCARWDGDGTIEPIGLPEGVTLEHLDVGYNRACALAPDGEAWCWGTGGVTSTSRDTAVPSGGGLRFSTISVGDDRHACGVELGSGRVHCWGSNEAGQLGDGTQEYRAVPVATNLTGVIGVVARGSNTCAWDAGGQTHCWGNAAGGALGSGVREDSPVPLLASAFGQVATASLESDVTCAVGTDGRTMCMGGFHWGPFPVTYPDALTSVAAADASACGLDPAGQAWCWGQDREGNIGSGTTSAGYFYTASAVVGGHTFAGLSSGPHHVCGWTPEGTLWCWGSGHGGRLGNGDFGSSGTPVRVVGQ